MSKSEQDAAVAAGFDVQVGALQYVAEADFGKDLRAIRKVVEAIKAPSGRLILQGGGQPDLAVSDELLPLTSALYAVLRVLAAKDVAFLDRYSGPGVLRFERAADAIMVSDDNGEERRYDGKALLAALAACAGRMTATLRTLKPQDGGWSAKLERLDKAPAG